MKWEKVVLGYRRIEHTRYQFDAEQKPNLSFLVEFEDLDEFGEKQIRIFRNFRKIEYIKMN